MAEITIRKSTYADLDRLMEIYHSARVFMRSTGNVDQWTNGYPSRDIVRSDIDLGNSYVGLDEDGEIIMTFAFILGDDPTYGLIENGSWPDSRPYGTIHRLASAGKKGGMLKTCVDFCLRHIDTIRLDTHADNHPMQSAALRLGFKPCGIIYCQDGTPRLAYQL